MKRVHPFSAALAVTLVLLTGATSGPAYARSTPKYASGLPWSDGGFFEHSAAKASAFAQWRGAPVDNITAYTSRATWNQQLNDWWAGTVPSSFKPARDDFILSVPLWTDDGQAGTDQQWQELGRKISAVDPDGLVRLGWEMNCCFSHATDAQKWRKQFSRAVTQLRTSAPRLQIVFNPNEGGAQNGTTPAIEKLYVKGKVDIIALDSYDWWKPFTTASNINSHFTKKYGWNYWYKFARDRGLPFALAEFSVSSASSASGGDNPKFFDVTYRWLQQKAKSDPGSIRFVSLFNESAPYCECALSATQNRKAAGKYKSLIARAQKN
ncbi:glycoside hydrolase family 26 protein [Kineosporia babensis]|uniref:GH26 domain-containing protein n=1 Tax=Kineosporia babensis TaxID=499548 RepID=A0A9X1NAC8_9ACTN|nr:hypothetical protein [Kineosporia babensis]MCD5311302.1 hypothetical protein [Kineosporia babensis]